jgi:DNA-binding NarL/FixJ family response regulator
MTAVDEDRRTAPMTAEAEVPAPDRQRGRTRAATPLGLTPRERDVFEMIGLALTNREIGSRLCLSEKTVKSHVTAVMRKLGVRNRVEAALISAGHHGVEIR